MHPTLEVTAEPKLSLDEAMETLAGLNALGRQADPTFGVRLQADRESETTQTLERTYITVASYPKARMPAAVDHVARALLGVLSRRGGSGSVQLGETVVQIAPAVTPEEIVFFAGQLAGTDLTRSSPAPPPVSVWPDPAADPEAFRSFVHAISGLTVEGIVQTSTIDEADAYSARCSEGDLLLLPNGSGWTLVLIKAGGDKPIRTWSDVPTPQALVMELILDGMLNSPPPGVQPEFRSIQLDLDTNVERKYFASLDGPIVVHTRQQRAGAVVETVLELKAQGRIFALPPTNQLIGDFERRELTMLPF